MRFMQAALSHPAGGQGCNVRHEHTFIDEDAMGWLKRRMAATKAH